jgi:4-amino-4-deoxy-L-arabinose transferase-like glycosyltransferase
MDLVRDAGAGARGVTLPLARLRAGWWFPAALLAVCALPVLLYVPFLHEPFMRDEGFYASVAQSMLDGGIPYRDAFDNKPPIVFAHYALSFLLFGENVWAPRLLVALMLSAATGLLYLQARLIYSRGWALLAAAAFASSLGLAQFETNANVEYFMLLPLIASVLAYSLSRRSGSSLGYLAAGVLAGITIMTKETALFVFALFFLESAWNPLRRDGLRALASAAVLRPWALMVAGAVLAGALISAPFVLTGTFGDMYEAMVTYTLQYVGAGRTMAEKVFIIARSPVYLLLLAGPWFVLGIAGAVRAWRRNPDGQRLFLVGFLATSWMGIIAAGRFYDHYYVLLLPALALLTPLGVHALASAWRNRYARILVAGLLPLSAVAPLYFAGSVYLQPNAAERHAAKYPTDYKTEWEIRGPLLADWIKERTEPSDYIYNFGFNSEIYFYSDRKSPTRFMFDHPFQASPEYEQRAIEEMETHYPVYIVDTASLEHGSDINYYSLPIHQWIEENYEYVGRVYYADVYRLRDGVGD